MKQSKKLFVVEAPISEGSSSRGSQRAFSFLRKHGLPETLPNAQFKPLTRVLPRFDNKAEAHNVAKVMRTNKRLLRVLEPALRRGQIAVTIGGDHSVAIGTLASTLSVYGEDIAVVYVDAHADINTEKTSITGNIHGMPLASAMGLCCKSLTLGQNRLVGSNVYMFGTRSVDDAEWQILSEQKVNVWTAVDVKQLGAESIANQIIEATKGKKVHVSFDVDCIDGSEFTSTGYVVPAGPHFDDVTEFLSRILHNCDVVAFDCVEYNPTVDKADDYKKVLKVLSLLNGLC